MDSLNTPLTSKPTSSILKTIEVYLPDMFVSFLSLKPKVNPHYEQVKQESENWISERCNYNTYMRKRITKMDFSYFCSIGAPEAGVEELKTVCDWGNWVFPFDDMFDEGHLGKEPELANSMMNRLLYHMREGKELLGSKEALVNVHDSVWLKIVKKSSEGVQRRFHRAMESYCKGALEHVDDCTNGKIPSIEEFLAKRRRSAGVSPLFSLVEYAHGLQVPDEIFEYESIKEIERLGTDFVLIQNDILSYQKEEAEEVNHNLVAVCRQSGMTAQEAFDRVGSMLQSCYRDWYLALASLPQWDEKTDREVYRYIQGVQNVVYANLHWSFKSERYLGKLHDVVREKKIITVRQDDVEQLHRNSVINRRTSSQV